MSVSHERIDYSHTTTQDLARREQRYRKLLLSLANDVWVSDADAINAMIVCGSSVDERVSSSSPVMQLVELLHPDDREGVMRDIADSLRNGTPFSSQARTLEVEGQCRHLLMKGVPIVEGNCVIEWAGATLDITDQKRAEQALRDNQNRLRDAQAIAGIGSFYWDAVANRVYWSDELYRLFGEDPRQFEVTYTSYVAHIHPEDRTMAVATISKALETGESFTSEYRITTGDGHIRWIASLGRAICDEHGTVIGMEGTCQDITQRVETQTRHAANQADLLHISRISTLGQITSALAHEINQPLAAIVNFCGACLARLEEQPTPDLTVVHKNLNEISQQALRAGQVVRRLREISGKGTPTHQPLDLHDLIRDAIHLLAINIRSRNICMSSTLEGDSPRVIGDRLQLQQVFVNLLSNAADATDGAPLARRLILIDTERRPGQTGIHITDYGCGIPAEIRPKLFAPFVTSKSTGMGLGLSICQRIVEAHGGSIEVSCFAPEAENDPTTRFTVWLPHS